VFSVSPSIAEPNQGLGAGAGFWLAPHVYSIATVADANGNPTSPNLEVYTSSRSRQFIDNIHLTLWQQYERKAAGIPEDMGISASAYASGIATSLARPSLRRSCPSWVARPFEGPKLPRQRHRSTL
jgi:hypothetical protein